MTKRIWSTEETEILARYPIEGPISQELLAALPEKSHQQIYTKRYFSNLKNPERSPQKRGPTRKHPSLARVEAAESMSGGLLPPVRPPESIPHEKRPPLLPKHERIIALALEEWGRKPEGDAFDFAADALSKDPEGRPKTEGCEVMRRVKSSRGVERFLLAHSDFAKGKAEKVRMLSAEDIGRRIRSTEA